MSDMSCRQFLPGPIDDDLHAKFQGPYCKATELRMQLKQLTFECKQSKDKTDKNVC